MKLKVLGSSSSGNCYILENDREALIIEAGAPLKAVIKALDRTLGRVAACLVSHEHDDHAKYVREYAAAGITVLSSESVFSAKKMGLLSMRRKIIEPGKGYSVGGFRVIAFDLAHDVPCLGFFITHPETGGVLFITDTYYCEYTFPGLANIIIECNYSDEILDRNIELGRMPVVMRSRLLHSHMELQNCKEYLLANDLSDVVNIVLAHLSDGNSDEKKFVEEILLATGKSVYAADKGLCIEFNATPF